jgi:Holliday junction resolvase RusA-like endonuclease
MQTDTFDFMDEARGPVAVTFTVPGKPFAKQRPRASVMRFGGKIRINMRTPPETVSFERQVGQIAAPLFHAPFDGPVRLVVEAIFEPAASWSGKRRAAAIGQHHTQKPDGDNLLKAVSDGLNRIAWADDAQVAEIVMRKRWGLRAETVVIVEAL